MAVEEKGLANIFGYDLLEDEIKKRLALDPKLQGEIHKWTNKYIDNRFLFGVKECQVEYVDYTNLDFEDLDEIELKELKKVIRKNSLVCPNHTSCPLFLGNKLVKGEKCLLEMADASSITQALTEELKIDPKDYNDQLTVYNLVAMNVIGNRALRGLSTEGLIKETTTLNKGGGYTYDTKVNDNFAVFEKSIMLGDKLKKALVLNRDDKLKYKQIEDGKNKATVVKNVADRIKSLEEKFKMKNISDIIGSEDETPIEKIEAEIEDIS